MTDSDKCPEECLCGSEQRLPKTPTYVVQYVCGSRVTSAGELLTPCPKAHEIAIELKEEIKKQDAMIIEQTEEICTHYEMGKEKDKEIEQLKGLLKRAERFLTVPEPYDGMEEDVYEWLGELKSENPSPEPVEGLCDDHWLNQEEFGGTRLVSKDQCPKCNPQTTKEEG